MISSAMYSIAIIPNMIASPFISTRILLLKSFIKSLISLSKSFIAVKFAAKVRNIYHYAIGAAVFCRRLLSCIQYVCMTQQNRINICFCLSHLLNVDNPLNGKSCSGFNAPLKCS